MKLEAVVEQEARGCFDFFWNEANADPSSPGYGLIRDRDTPDSPCSIAATGFGLSALPIGVERGWVGRLEAEQRARGTLETFRKVERTHGFYFHFLDMKSGARFHACEVSVIDTALLACGMITAGEYFGGATRRLAEKLVAGIVWPWYRDPAWDQFRMGYWPERGFEGSWSFADEQLVMYVLGAGSAAHPTPGSMFYSFTRKTGSYGGGKPLVHSTVGSLFTYQFSHAWIDFRGMHDRGGVDWFTNSVDASIAARQYCIDNPERLRALGAGSWGLTACNAPHGYCGTFGAPPSGRGPEQGFHNDGTLAPCGAAGSIAFTPEESIAALTFYASLPGLQGRYGLVDAYNLDTDPAWCDRRVLGIDKGITLLMIENHRSGLVWELFMRNEAVRRGLAACGISDK